MSFDISTNVVIEISTRVRQRKSRRWGSIFLSHCVRMLETAARYIIHFHVLWKWQPVSFKSRAGERLRYYANEASHWDGLKVSENLRNIMGIGTLISCKASSHFDNFTERKKKLNKSITMRSYACRCLRPFNFIRLLNWFWLKKWFGAGYLTI